ncbi:LOW QUALITY PROTEIN: PWWP domain-containing protein 2A-like [Nilaparvata lugens]|uniref:LOW QUALITY PROTEIN: PWWP domain-containing protein 2A-like n=1 Tax=Nilaparvata lugens TaxID=108931 RepID=UPI00193D2092|nr:LOW QUALITY PROTEIN: PWWP domain-containing protein 2A-like [Nilaparvata lugens]
MADLDILSQLKILKNSKISVDVDEVLPDILVVSYSFESKVFKGVLLDSTKRNLPCGINGPANFPDQIFSPKPEHGEDDKLFTVNQRFTYFQPQGGDKAAKPGLATTNHFHMRREIRPPARFRGAKMTVRLRPRQVLCSKCRSICNENSENVDHSAARGKKTPPFSENQTSNLDTRLAPATAASAATLIPKLSRLKPNEISNAINGMCPKPSLEVNYWLGGNATPKPTETDLEEDSDSKMVLRKKRSVGSMEDLWDESVFEEAAKRTKTTPVIKISFGGQGEGEVVKIPSKLQNCSESEAEDKQKAASAKAAKRALKKAKKEARRKLNPGSSPVYRKHRHKVKHKKKRKLENEATAVCRQTVAEIKDRCLKQKLSISLRRLNATAYASGPPGTEAESAGSSPATSHSSEEALPDFPPSPSPQDDGSHVVMASTRNSDGRLLAVGDIVWGKIHGFPWWPGKVLSITLKDEASGSRAHVAWYGSSTSSLMPCDQLSPFLETFKSRFNKKKKSSQYKEAIKQASSEATSSRSSAANNDVSASSAANDATMPPVLTQLLCASPTQVHVVS